MLSARQIFEAAVKSARSGQAAHARAQLAQGLRAFPQDGNLWHLEAQLAAGMGDTASAQAAYERLLRLRPDHPETQASYGQFLLAHAQAAAARPWLEKAFAAGISAVAENLAHARLATGERAGALAAFDRAAASSASAYSNAAGMRAWVCDWAGLDSVNCAALDPAHTLFLTDDPALQRRAAERYAQRVARPLHPAPARAHGDDTQRLRIGYLSADFHAHATAYLMGGLFAMHDRARFHVSAISYGPDDGSPARQRIKDSADVFCDLAGQPLAQAVAALRALALDVLVDLKGYTRGGRPELLQDAEGRKIAPVQMHWLGYPGPLALPALDYLIADAEIIPPALRAHYPERIIFLPAGYQMNDRARPCAAPPATREAEGLPKDAQVLASFSQTYKITRTIFAVWCDVLRAQENAVLWLYAPLEEAQKNLRAAARDNGINPARLIFAASKPLAEHLARLKLADLLLDTYPYGGHTSCADALWCAVPYLALEGRTFASRVAASLLRRSGVPELVAEDLAGYRAKALAGLNDPPARAAWRARLDAARDGCPIFNAPAFARALEAAYTEAAARAAAGLPPADIVVEG